MEYLDQLSFPEANIYSFSFYLLLGFSSRSLISLIIQHYVVITKFDAQFHFYLLQENS